MRKSPTAPILLALAVLVPAFTFTAEQVLPGAETSNPLLTSLPMAAALIASGFLVRAATTIHRKGKNQDSPDSAEHAAHASAARQSFRDAFITSLALWVVTAFLQLGTPTTLWIILGYLAFVAGNYWVRYTIMTRHG